MVSFLFVLYVISGILSYMTIRKVNPFVGDSKTKRLIGSAIPLFNTLVFAMFLKLKLKKESI